jgi:hypothetical protein
MAEVYAAASMVANKAGHGRDRARLIEKAMSDAVMKALSDGVPISDSAEINARMMDARRKVIDSMNG